MSKQYLIWLLPFIFFFLGYSTISYFVSIQDSKAPALVGQRLQNALKIASTHRVNLRISSEKEDPDILEGTILSQSILPGSPMKSQQPLFVVIARKPEALCAPQLVGKQEKEVDEIIKKTAIREKKYMIESYLPIGCCIGQFPAAGVELVEQEPLIIYISAGVTPVRLMPDMRGYELAQVRSFAELYSLPLKIIGEQPKDADAQKHLVIEQRPLPGSLVNITYPLTLQIMLQNYAGGE